MKNLLSLLLVLSQIVPATSLAAISAPDRADIPAPINAVTNSSGQRGLAGWVKGGTPTFSVSTSPGAKVAGVASFTFNAASSSDYVETGALTLTDDTTGDCEASISVKGNGTGYSLQLMSGTSVLNSIALTNNTGFKTHAFNYPCGTGYKLRIASSGDNAAINFGAVYWGKATNLGAINPITNWQSYTPIVTPGSGSITSPVLDYARYRQVGDSIHVQIQFVGTQSTANAFAWTFALPPGISLQTDPETVVLAARRTSVNVIGGGVQKVGGVRVGNSATSVEVTPLLDGGTFTVATQYAVSLEFSQRVVGWTAQTAVRQDQTFDRTGEVMSYMSECPSNTVSAMGKTIGKTSGDYQGEAYWPLYAKLWRSGLPPSGTQYGISISDASETSAAAAWAAGRTIKLEFRDLFLRGIGPNAFSNATVGLYQDDRFQGHRHSLAYSGNPTSGYGGLQRVEGTEGSEGWVWDPITDGTNGTPRTASETRPKNVGVNYCVNYTGTQPAPVLVGSVNTDATTSVASEVALWDGTGANKVKRATGSGAAVLTNGVLSTVAAGTSGNVLTSNGTTFTSAAPSITSGGTERVERLRISGAASEQANCTSSPCTIRSQSGAWVSNIVRNSTGIYTVFFAAGAFSAIPVCVCSGVSSGTDYVACSIEAPTTTNVALQTFQKGAITMLDSNIQLICMGPR